MPRRKMEKLNDRRCAVAVRRVTHADSVRTREDPTRQHEARFRLRRGVGMSFAQLAAHDLATPYRMACRRPMLLELDG